MSMETISFTRTDDGSQCPSLFTFNQVSCQVCVLVHVCACANCSMCHNLLQCLVADCWQTFAYSL